jgi:hypothetical protein
MALNNGRWWSKSTSGDDVIDLRWQPLWTDAATALSLTGRTNSRPVATSQDAEYMMGKRLTVPMASNGMTRRARTDPDAEWTGFELARIQVRR